jgi:hypothetical protein
MNLESIQDNTTSKLEESSRHSDKKCKEIKLPAIKDRN